MMPEGGHLICSWCYHIPVSSSPEDFMKTDQSKLVMQRILKGTLLVGLGLSSMVSYLLLRHTPEAGYRSSLLVISLGNSLLLAVMLTIASILFKNIGTQSDPQGLDPLTGLKTRHSLWAIFQETLDHSQRTLEPLSVLLIDIDHFRLVNERYGHMAGDEILAMLGESIRAVLRGGDLTCRWEGDQILAVLENCGSRDSCRIAEKILKEFRLQTLRRGRKKIKITVSIGVAQMVSGDTAESLTERAETGLYAARDNGRDGYAIGYDWILIEYRYDPIF